MVRSSVKSDSGIFASWVTVVPADTNTLNASVSPVDALTVHDTDVPLAVVFVTVAV